MTDGDLESSAGTDGERLVRRLGAWAAIVGPTVFVVTFTVEGWLRPDYNAAAMFVSALSLGSSGWIQVLNFVVVGLSFLAFARGVSVGRPSGLMEARPRARAT
jgi:hypothetical protein